MPGHGSGVRRAVWLVGLLVLKKLRKGVLAWGYPLVFEHLFVHNRVCPVW